MRVLGEWDIRLNNMSIEYCEKCNKHIDTDYDSEHFDEHMTDEFKKGYNQCLKDLGKTGEKYQHLYL